MNLPRGRHDDLLTTNLEDELVIYDPESKQAHSLNRLAVAIWKHADGSKTIGDLQRLAAKELGVPVDQATVLLALRKLERARLLIDKFDTDSPLTRREMLHKAGRLGATAIVTPIVASALIPMASAAASSVAGTCTNVQAGCVNNGNCNANGNCFCYMSAEGGAACGQNVSCAAAPPCTSSSQCPSGTVCIVNTCCPAGVCVPICPPGAAVVSRLHTPGPGMATR
jgi:hypothetical protein